MSAKKIYYLSTLLKSTVKERSMLENVGNVWTEDDRASVTDRIMPKIGMCGCGSNTQWEIIKLLLERGVEQGARLESTTRQERQNNPVPGFYDPIGEASRNWVEFG